MRSKVFADGNRRAFFSSMIPLHYESALDSRNFDVEINAGLQRINNAQLDGWMVTQNGWHYALGSPGDKTGDGWVGFGGRKGQNFLQFRLARMGYLHGSTRSFQDVAGTPVYGRGNLSQETRSIEIKPTGQTLNVMSSATWANIWSTPGGGRVDIRWRVMGDRLKEDIIINQAGRDFIRDNAPPLTPAAETYFGFIFQIDPSDIPRWVVNDSVRDIEGDFSDDDGRIEIRDASDRLLGFMPVDYVTVAFDEKPARLNIDTIKQRLHKRIWKDPDGNYYLLIGCRVDLLANMIDGDLVFDPTWGQTDLGVNADDGFDGYGDWNVDGLGGNNYCDEQGGDNNWPGWSWATPAIADNSTFNEAFFRAYNDTHSGTVTANISVEDVDPASQTQWDADHLPRDASPIWQAGAADYADIGDNQYYFGDGDEGEENIAGAFAALQTSYGEIASGDRINIYLEPGASGSDFFGFTDYSAAGNLPQLYIDWTEPAGGRTTKNTDTNPLGQKHGMSFRMN